MGRQGLNGNLSYTVGGTKYAFSVRVGEIAHGSQMVAEEAQSRTRRAYYPHRLSAQPFSLTILVRGHSERTLLANFLADYTTRALDANLTGAFPSMLVTVWVRNFLRWGVPMSGIEWGNRTGAIVWKPVVVFETTMDSLLGDTAATRSSEFVLPEEASRRAPELKYFYPRGIQLSGNQVPSAGDYPRQVGTGDIDAIIKGGTPGGSNAGGGEWYPPYAPGQGSGNSDNPWAN